MAGGREEGIEVGTGVGTGMGTRVGDGALRGRLRGRLDRLLVGTGEEILVGGSDCLLIGTMDGVAVGAYVQGQNLALLISDGNASQEPIIGETPNLQSFVSSISGSLEVVATEIVSQVHCDPAFFGFKMVHADNIVLNFVCVVGQRAVEAQTMLLGEHVYVHD